MDVNEELKFLRKFTKKSGGGWGRGVRDGGVRQDGGQGGCERRIEVFCENSKNGGFWVFGLGLFGLGGGWGGQGGCERRIEAFVKFKKKCFFSGGGGVGSGGGGG